MNILRLTIYILFVIFLTSCNANFNNNELLEKADNQKDKVQKQPDTNYSVNMVGDIMLGSNYPTSHSLPPDDGKTILSQAFEYLADADVTLGNLEGTLLNKGGLPKECDEPENCFSFRMPERYANHLKNAGFDIMSLANNHSGDMGETGRKPTVNTLIKSGIQYAGYITCPTTIFIKDGIKFGFASFAPNAGTLNINNIKKASEIIHNLKKQCNIVIISFHGGAEGSNAVRVLKAREYYLGENRGNVYEFAHRMIDAGADIVFGHGPHVPRALELYNDRLIAYSLGNFCTYDKFGLSGNLGLAPILTADVNKDGKFIKGRIIPFRQVKRGIPVYDNDKLVIRLISRLTLLDFPETPLSISGDGEIEVKD